MARSGRKKRILSLLICLILFGTVLAGCESNSPADTTASQQQPNVSPGKVDETNVTEGNVSYTVYKYTAPVTQVVRYSGENLALNKTATASSEFNSGLPASNAFNGNRSDMWASGGAEDKNPYIQVDLGEPMQIGAVEIVHRPDGNSAGQRAFFEVQVSNDPEFKTYEVIGVQGSQPYEYGWSYITNCTLTEKFQYVRMQRTHNTGHIAIAEMLVYGENKEVPEERPVETKPEGAMQIVSKSTGKALSVYEGSPVAEEYTFRNLQRWLVEETGEDNVMLKNASTGKYLTCVDNKLSFADKQDGDSQIWIKKDLGANWYSLTSKNGGTLTIKDGDLAVCSAEQNTEDEKWDISDAYIEELPKSDTSWMQNCYGVMYHLLADLSNKKIIDKFVDVDAICDQLKDVGASYFLLSVGQNSGYFIAPNDKYSSIVTLKPEMRATERDLIMEFALALKERGIKLMVYTSAAPPSGMKRDNDEFLMGDNSYNSRRSAMLWSMVIREWSLKYGDLISGWWVDGAYADQNPYEDILAMYVNAMKAGNPNAVVALNPGIVIAERGELADYTAGETDYPFGSDDLSLITNPDNWMTPEHNKVSEDVQWFMLTFLDKGWCHNGGPRKQLYDKELWGQYVKTVLDQGGAICLDVKFTMGTGSDYTMYPEMYEILKEIQRQYYGS